jgi:hypothetical protein
LLIPTDVHGITIPAGIDPIVNDRNALWGEMTKITIAVIARGLPTTKGKQEFLLRQ